jgi:prepilin-type N-terminal cleavage/methylation domain-containing protein
VNTERGYSMIEVLLVVALSSVIAAIAVPMMKNSLGGFRLNGDARTLTNAVSLAKLRAAADFSQARVYVDLSTNAYHVETWAKTAAAWTAEGGTTTLSTNDTFSYGVITTPPTNTQTAIGQASACVTNLGVAVANTACVLFNSRGIPVLPAGAPPAVGAPTGDDALYITDGTAVYGVMLSATGLIRLYRSNPTATPNWTLQ